MVFNPADQKNLVSDWSSTQGQLEELISLVMSSVVFVPDKKIDLAVFIISKLICHRNDEHLSCKETHIHHGDQTENFRDKIVM
jgi:hypothetical protein